MLAYLLDLLTSLLKLFIGDLVKKYYRFSELKKVVILIKYFSF